MKNQEDDFYSEVDKRSLHKSCCTFQTLIIFFVILLVITLSGAIYCYRQIKKINLSSKIVTSSSEDKNNFINKLQPESGAQTFEISITSEELTAVTSGGIAGKNLLIKNTQVIISADDIIIYGSLVKPISSELKIKTIPKVVDKKIKFEVQSATAGDLGLPNFINQYISDGLNKAMDENFSKLYQDYEVLNINLFSDKMVISGKIK